MTETQQEFSQVSVKNGHTGSAIPQFTVKIFHITSCRDKIALSVYLVMSLITFLIDQKIAVMAHVRKSSCKSDGNVTLNL